MNIKVTISAFAFSLLAISYTANAENSNGELSKQQKSFAEKKEQITHASDFASEKSSKERALFQTEIKKDAVTRKKPDAN